MGVGEDFCIALTISFCFVFWLFFSFLVFGETKRMGGFFVFLFDDHR